MIQSIDYAAISPPLILVVTAGVALLLDAFFPALRGRLALLDVVTLTGIAAALAAVVLLARGANRGTFCVPGDMAGDGPASCSFVIDGFSLLFAGLVLVVAVIVVLISAGELRPRDSGARRTPAGEWQFLLLCSLAGAVALPASRDLVMLVVSLELLTVPIFVMTGMRRHDGRSGEAALKLLLVSVVSTGVMLYGASLIFGITGEVHLDRIALALGQPVHAGLLAAGIVLVLAGFAFKVAAVPFHFWAGDVYEGAPLPVAALLSVISKAAGFAGLILLLTAAFPMATHVWAPTLAVLAALTMTAGNLLALRQRNAVRLLAWSSVAQSGYMLAPLAAGVAGAAATKAYVVLYAAMNIGAFAVVALVARERPGNGLDDYRGLFRTNPAAALGLGFFLVCLAGLPPGLAGLFAKIVVFRPVIEAGIGWLAVVMAVNTVIGLYYYIAWAARLFAEPGVYRSRLSFRPATTAIAIALVATAALSVAPQLVLGLV